MELKKLNNHLHQKLLNRLPATITKSQARYMEETHETYGMADAVDRNEEVNLPLPGWAKDVYTTAADAVKLLGEPTINRLETFLDRKAPRLPTKRPDMRTGWQRFTESGWERCEAPTSKSAMVLDFETVEVSTNKWMPFCCSVLSDEYWYVWLGDLNCLPSVIDFSHDQVIIAHNAGYDRAYLASEYTFKQSGNRFFDTMSAWMTVRGFTNQQRSLYLKAAKGEIENLEWFEETAVNSLSAVYEYYTGIALDKQLREGIVTEGIDWVRDNLEDVVWYCIKDVLATYRLFTHVYPELKVSQPSPISLTGQLLLGNTWLPLSSSRWSGYYDKAESKFLEVKGKVEERLEELANEVLANPTEEQLNSEIMDWSTAKTGKNKGLPKWYRDCKGQPSLGSRIAPVILRCKWRGSLVKWHRESSKMGWWYTEDFGDVPHPQKKGKKVTNLFMKDMVEHAETGVLDAEGGMKDLLRAVMQISNWTSLRERVSKVKTENPEGYPVTLPQIVVTGTVTRRCKDNIWQVAANPKPQRIGTELKSMIEAPPGYSLVGADVDSQELWLAACLGDAVEGICGSTALGLMTLIGTKADKTDPHSKVAASGGLKRDDGKNIVYGTIYGLGLKGAMDNIAKSNPNLSPEDVKQLAFTILNSFKGRKNQYGRYVGGLGSETFNEMEKIANSQCPQTSVLKAKISNALRGIRDFQTTRVNWTIQSLGVDMRDIYVTYLTYFFHKMKIEGRILMTIHDEFRTIVKDEHVKRGVYALQLAHLYTRAYIIDALGLDCIPSGAAYHSSVDVDKVLRKDPKDPQITPSQTEAIPPGYEVRPSEMLAWWPSK